MGDITDFIVELDAIIDNHNEDIPYSRLELLFQKRAQDMRELALETEEYDTMRFDEIDSYDEL